MTRDDRLPLVTDERIASFVGPLAFGRGRNYVQDERVISLRWDAPYLMLTGRVAGSAGVPYLCRVMLEETERGGVRIEASECSCPVGFACKHAAAVLLAASAQRRAAEREHEHSRPEGWRGELAAIADAAGTAARAAGRPGPGSGAVAGAGRPQHTRRPLGLQFEPRERVATSGRWGAARDRPARRGGVVERLGVRPLTAGKRGGWIKGDLTWQNVGFRPSSDFDPDQTRWFSQFVLLQSMRQTGFVTHGSELITLDGYESALLWVQLADAARLGIPLVQASGGDVIVGEAAEIGFDMSERGDGALALAPVVRIDGVSHLAEQARAIGTHGVYVVFGDTIRLAPVVGSITAEQRAVIGSRDTIVVPDAERTDFLRDYYPRIGRALAMTSDGSVELPAIAPATLVLGAHYGAKHELRLSWQWRHADGLVSTLEAETGEAERAVVHAVEAITGGELATPLTLRGIDAAEFSAVTLPRLSGIERVRVEVEGVRPDYREMLEPPKLTVSTVASTQTDWFDLGVIVTVEGKKIPFRALFTALAKGRRKLLLVDNSYLSLDQPVFEPLRALLEEAGTIAEWETGVRINRYQTALWSEFEDLADEAEPAVEWRETVEGLRDGATVDAVDVPADFTGELRPYQLDGFRWLAFLWRHRLGGILADDMGLGKTAQTLALIAHARAEGKGAPFLVVAPTSVVSTWASEAARFTPGLTVRTITATAGTSGTQLTDAAAGADIIVTSYAILRLDAERFAALDWAGLVLDEAQFAKNASTKVHQAARGIRAPFRLAVTGTPMENNLGELWALFQIVAPGLFASRRRFDEEYRRPVENDDNLERLARLRRRIRPLMLRRTKDLVARELPAKQEQVLQVELDPRHRRLYEATLQKERQKLLGLVEDLDRNRFIVFRSLTLLRMLALDAALIDPEANAGIPSAKLDALFEQLDEVLAEGHRALVFSQFTSFLKRAAERFEAAGVPYAYLDGSTRKRPEVIEDFRSGQAPVFLISLKAGGFGLTLTEADYVFLLDPWWNPATESQAVDRAHRIGQDKTVMVYRMVATGTIEEKVMALKARKGELAASVLDDESLFSQALTADDIRGLLA
jgi:superfamily II DNA or RNA helicase